jgi:hypothetical protein
MTGQMYDRYGPGSQGTAEGVVAQVKASHVRLQGVPQRAEADAALERRTKRPTAMAQRSLRWWSPAGLLWLHQSTTEIA